MNDSRRNKRGMIILTLIFVFLLINQKSFGQTSVTTVYFLSNSYKIDSTYYPKLNDIGEKCTSDSFALVKIFGYADVKGSAKHNEALSMKRAEEVMNYLIAHFTIDASKIYVTWLGESKEELYELHFPEAKVQQRCVDILYFVKEQTHR